jgi:hypothetical protein
MKLAVGIPTFSGVDNTSSLLALQQEIPFKYIEHRGHPVIAQARNQVFNEFLESDCTHLLSLDGDIHFHPEAVHDCVAQRKPIVGIAYLKRNEPGWNALIPNGTAYIPGLPFEVNALGLGFLLFHRCVLETYKANNPLRFYWENGNKRWAFTDCELHDGIYVCDAYTFCHRMREQGEKIYCLPEWPLNHSGKIGCLMEAMNGSK